MPNAPQTPIQTDAASDPEAQTFAMTGKGRGVWVQRIVIIAVIIAGIVVYCAAPAAHQAVDAVLAMFATGDFSVVKDFIAAYGPWAAAISFALMVAQSVIAPLPAFLITIANANLFGWWQGAILSWTSSMVGAALCFWIARALGREVVEKLTFRANLRSIDVFFDRHGNLAVLICRLLPFVSFDFVSYAAGLTSMRFSSFIIFTGIGQLPATIVYSYVGGMLTGGAQALVTGLLILFALGAFAILLRQVFVERRKRRGDLEKARGR